MPSVGGRYGDGEPPVLLVKVRERAVDGAANEAVIAAVAEAFGVKHRDAVLITGASSRSKLLEVVGATPDRLRELLEALA